MKDDRMAAPELGDSEWPYIGADPGVAHLPVTFDPRQGPPPRRRSGGPLWWLAFTIGLAVFAAAALLTVAPRGPSGFPLAPRAADPDAGARALAVQHARDTATLDWAAAWADYSPCFQTANPESGWAALRRQETSAVGAESAPGDATYTAVSVQAEGIYRRVEVRVQAPGRAELDYEIDVRRYGAAGRWVVVDTGPLGHAPISDACAAGGQA